MTIEQFLAEQGLTPEEIQAVVGNEKQAKAMTAALKKFDDGSEAVTRAEAEKQETAQFWEQKTQELQGSVQRLTAAERRAAQAEADAARIKAYNKSLADQGYDVPKEMYEGAPSDPATTATTKPNGDYVTREDFRREFENTAPTLISLNSLSNEYMDLYGSPYLTGEADYAEARKSNKPLRDYVRSKYDFDGKRSAKAAAADQARIDAIVNEKMKARETELAAKYGSNPDLRTPMPSKFDKLTKQEGFKSDSWKSRQGRDANRADRLKKFENISIN